MSVNVGKSCIKSALSTCQCQPTSKKSVVFSRYPDKVYDITWTYPKDFFYTQSETNKFRQEAREEMLGSAVSPVQRAFNIASSSYLMALFLPIGLIFCLPLLLLLPLIKIFFSSHEHESEVDTSILPSPPATVTNKGRSSTRRRGAYMEHRDSINLHKQRVPLTTLDDDE